MRSRPPGELSRRQYDRAARLLSALAGQGRRLEPVGEERPERYELRVNDENAPRLVADASLVGAMLQRDWLETENGSIGATSAGLAWLRRRAAGEDAWRGQHLETETAEIVAPDGGRTTATLVANESPLAWLRRRRGSGGAPLISETQYQAGERLRAEFERGRLTPRVTADWTRPSMGRQRRGPGGGVSDVTDGAIAARQRVESAFRALGPDLGSLLIHVCCFLTGIEDAERRRGWPRRSAKVVLGIALDRLAAHYGLSETTRGSERSGRVLHWGEEDYRPRIDAGTDTGPVS